MRRGPPRGGARPGGGGGAGSVAPPPGGAGRGGGRGPARDRALGPPPAARPRSGRCLSLLEPPLRLLLEPGLACSLLGLELRDLTLDRVVEALALGQPALGPRPL